MTFFWRFLKEELVPYPGRAALVARIVAATTLAMLITMTFRLPFGAYCAVYAFTISRESPQTTVSTAVKRTLSLALGAIYVLIGAAFFVEDPTLRLLWVMGSLFLVFYLLSAMTPLLLAIPIGYLIILTVPLWDRHLSSELRVEDTLWAVLALVVGSWAAVLVEVLFEAARPGDDLLRSIDERLASIQELLSCYAADRQVEQATAKKITSLALLGTSRLRRILRTSNYPRDYGEQMGAVIALVGRLVDIAASLMRIGPQADSGDRQRMQTLAANIATLRADLQNRKAPDTLELSPASTSAGGVPLLREMEKTAALIPEVFSHGGSTSDLRPSPPVDKRQHAILVPDAFSNPDHLKFGLKGGLAATLCYIVYNAIDWPGISTAVTTCLLTALTTVGFSRQKQILRFSGAVVGGFIFSMGAQILILPYLDTIFGFTILFAAVTAIAAWFSTSSPRLSYFGVQIVVAFYLINLQEFQAQISLGVARDRVVGILLGLLSMWLVFDQLWGTRASVELKKTYIANLRLLAEYARQTLPEDRESAIERSHNFREKINTNFDKIRSLADGALFEFGPTREHDLALRSYIREQQPQLRALFLTQITLFKYRLQLPGFELPEAVRQAQQEFDGGLAAMLDRMADRLEDKASPEDRDFKDAFEQLEAAVRSCCSEGSEQLLASELKTFLALLRTIEDLVKSLKTEILPPKSVPNLTAHGRSEHC